MASRSRTIATALATAINGLSLPSPISGFELNSPLAQAYFAPTIRRDVDNKLRIVISPFQNEIDTQQTFDRCGPRWITNLYVILEKKLSQDLNDDEIEIGPSTEIDFFTEFAEAVAEALAADKKLISPDGLLLGIEHTTLLSDEHLRSHVLFSQIGVTYG